MFLNVINYINIETTLKKLDTEYNLKIADSDWPILYSKLALLELSGWIEDSVDDLVVGYVDNHIVTYNIQTKIKEIIKKNHGFDYENNLFRLFSEVIGVNNFENIMDTLQSDVNTLKSITKKLSLNRNKAAHTSITVTRTYDAPSNILAYYRQLKRIFQIIEAEIKKL